MQKQSTISVDEPLAQHVTLNIQTENYIPLVIFTIYKYKPILCSSFICLFYFRDINDCSCFQICNEEGDWIHFVSWSSIHFLFYFKNPLWLRHLVNSTNLLVFVAEVCLIPPTILMIRMSGGGGGGTEYIIVKPVNAVTTHFMHSVNAHASKISPHNGVARTLQHLCLTSRNYAPIDCFAFYIYVSYLGR